MFDRQKFSEIFKSIYNKYDNQRDFASATGVNRAYISQYMNMKLENPPSPDILKKIANNSKGLTTYMELMMICGYITSDNLEERNKTLKLYKVIRDLKIKVEEKIASTELTNDEKLVVTKYVDDKFKNIDFNSNQVKQITIFKDIMDKFKEINKIPNIDNKKVYDYCMNKLILKTGNMIIFIYDSDIYRDYISSDNFELYENDNTNDKTPSRTQNSATYNTTRIPVLGSIPAGIPIELIQDIIDYEDISEDMLRGGKEYFALKVKGNSMWPKYLDGDTIIVLKQDNCESGEDCIVMVNGNDGTFKRVIKKDTGIILEPINQQEYNSVSYSNEDIEKLPVRILGVVKELRRSI